MQSGTTRFYTTDSKEDGRRLARSGLAHPLSVKVVNAGAQLLRHEAAVPEARYDVQQADSRPIIRWQLERLVDV